MVEILLSSAGNAGRRSIVAQVARRRVFTTDGRSPTITVTTIGEWRKLRHLSVHTVAHTGRRAWVPVGVVLKTRVEDNARHYSLFSKG